MHSSPESSNTAAQFSCFQELYYLFLKNIDCHHLGQEAAGLKERMCNMCVPFKERWAIVARHKNLIAALRANDGSLLEIRYSLCSRVIRSHGQISPFNTWSNCQFDMVKVPTQRPICSRAQYGTEPHYGSTDKTRFKGTIFDQMLRTRVCCIREIIFRTNLCVQVFIKYLDSWQILTDYFHCGCCNPVQQVWQVVRRLSVTALLKTYRWHTGRYAI